jgi:hypothetical protein
MTNKNQPTEASRPGDIIPESVGGFKTESVGDIIPF